MGFSLQCRYFDFAGVNPGDKSPGIPQGFGKFVFDFRTEGITQGIPRVYPRYMWGSVDTYI
jgi:hypothetical protein